LTVYLLNSLVAPINFDKHPEATVTFRVATLEEVRELLLRKGFVSAIGHEGTAKLLSQLLGISVPANRISVWMEPGDIGVHFYLKKRLPEGAVLTSEELAKLDYWLVVSTVHTRKQAQPHHLNPEEITLPDVTARTRASPAKTPERKPIPVTA